MDELDNAVVGAMLAKTESGLSVSALMLREMLKPALRRMDIVGRVISVGDGGERDLTNLAANGFNVAAYNLSPEALVANRERAREMGSADRVKFLRQNFLRASLRRGYYHGVVCSSVLFGFNAHDISAFSKKCAHAIMSEGVVVFSAPSENMFDEITMTWVDKSEGIARSSDGGQSFRLWSPKLFEHSFGDYFKSRATRYSDFQEGDSGQGRLVTMVGIRNDFML